MGVDDNSPIIGYDVYVKNKGGSFKDTGDLCVATSATETSCKIKQEALREDPFSLDWGDEVVAKITTRYENKKTLESEDGGEAILMTNPDPPTDLREDETKRTSNSIGIAWNEPNFKGGDISEYLEYRVWQKYRGGVYEVKIVKKDPYLTLVGLTAGQEYYFMV